MNERRQRADVRIKWVFGLGKKVGDFHNSDAFGLAVIFAIIAGSWLF
jgi:hypothetical protein